MAVVPLALLVASGLLVPVMTVVAFVPLALLIAVAVAAPTATAALTAAVVVALVRTGLLGVTVPLLRLGPIGAAIIDLLIGRSLRCGALSAGSGVGRRRRVGGCGWLRLAGGLGTTRTAGRTLGLLSLLGLRRSGLGLLRLTVGDGTAALVGGDGGHKIGLAHARAAGDAQLRGQGLKLGELERGQAAAGVRLGLFHGFGHEGFLLPRRQPDRVIVRCCGPWVCIRPERAAAPLKTGVSRGFRPGSFTTRHA